MCLMGKYRSLYKLCPGISYGAAGPEFNVNESAIY